jgi:hypothetical protein
MTPPALAYGRFLLGCEAYHKTHEKRRKIYRREQLRRSNDQTRFEIQISVSNSLGVYGFSTAKVSKVTPAAWLDCIECDSALQRAICGL